MKTCWTGIPEKTGAWEETALEVVGAAGVKGELDAIAATDGATMVERDAPPQPARSASARTRGCRLTGSFSCSRLLLEDEHAGDQRRNAPREWRLAWNAPL